MPVPVFFITANGKDITKKLLGLGCSLTVTDGEGIESDGIELELDDKDGRVEFPKTGAILQVRGGYSDTNQIRDFGSYSVDSVTLSGWPQKISISAKAVAAKSLAKKREPKAYKADKFPTYKHIFEDVAKSIGVSLSIHADIGAVPNDYEAQSDEDGVEFCLRIGEKLGASISIKSQKLCVVPKGKGQSASGSDLSTIKVTRPGNLLSYQVAFSDDANYSSVEASYYDRGKNEKKTVTTKVSSVKEKYELGESSGDPPGYVMRMPHDSEATARRAAGAKAKDLERAQANVTFEINGDPFAMAAAMVQASGIRKGANGKWRAKTVTHSFSATGPYTTSLQCDVPTE